jgi:ubiquinone/menaquinone biosynthesis C-methylase UbiE
MLDQQPSIRGRLCFALSRPALKRPLPRANAAIGDYQAWRDDALKASWSRFSDADVNGKDVLDFGCGNGPLSLFLAANAQPKSITGVDLYPDAIARAREALTRMVPPPAAKVNFLEGSEEGIPVPDQSMDTLLAFDCLEHVMEPAAILAEWHRVLRPGGKVLIEWFPFAGPYGPHMEALVPIPWAHILFGQRAMFEAAEQLYDDPEFQPRHWDLDDRGNKLPNKWRQWRSFAEQSYVNELSTGDFRRMVKAAGFSFARYDRYGLYSSRPRIAPITRALSGLPLIGQYFTSHVVIELKRG